jgi:hypothetical protein
MEDRMNDDLIREAFDMAKSNLAPVIKCKDCYYWRSAAETTNYFRCCHYALDNGKLRTKISKTECGSFEDRESKPKRKNPFPEVPVSQMGYTPPINWMSQR